MTKQGGDTGPGHCYPEDPTNIDGKGFLLFVLNDRDQSLLRSPRVCLESSWERAAEHGREKTHRWRERGPWESRRWSLDCGGTGPQARGGGRRQEDGRTEGGHVRGYRFGNRVMADLLPEKFLLLRSGKQGQAPKPRASVFFSWYLFYHLHNKQLGLEPCSPNLFKPRWNFKNTLLGDPPPSAAGSESLG